MVDWTGCHGSSINHAFQLDEFDCQKITNGVCGEVRHGFFDVVSGVWTNFCQMNPLIFEGG